MNNVDCLQRQDSKMKFASHNAYAYTYAYFYAIAMQSISTRAPAGRPNTAKVARAGGSDGKNSEYMAFTSAKYAISANRIVHLTTLVMFDPDSSTMFLRFVRTCLASAPTPPGTKAFVSLLIPKHPET